MANVIRIHIYLFDPMLPTYEQSDKQRLAISGTTEHQYLQPYLHNMKKYEFGQPIHNLKKDLQNKIPPTLYFTPI